MTIFLSHCQAQNIYHCIIIQYIILFCMNKANYHIIYFRNEYNFS